MKAMNSAFVAYKPGQYAARGEAPSLSGDKYGDFASGDEAKAANEAVGLVDMSVANVGSVNDGLPGDVVVGYFEQLKGWVYDGGHWYYHGSSGAQQYGWIMDRGSWYYLSSSGSMVTGWQLLGGTWYHLGANGAMTTGWYQEGPVWFYLRSNGSLATGWELIGWSWYHFAPSGAWIG